MIRTSEPSDPPFKNQLSGYFYFMHFQPYFPNASNIPSTLLAGFSAPPNISFPWCDVSYDLFSKHNFKNNFNTHALTGKEKIFEKEKQVCQHYPAANYTNGKGMN